MGTIIPAVGAAVVPPPKARVIVYIDGFNLYYGALKATPAEKWLDLAKFCQLLRPNDDIQCIRYFSAMVSGPTKPHQEEYLKALATTPLVNIVLGRFKDKRVRCAVTACQHVGARFYRVPEEKRTDVNIATFMLDDAYQDACDHLILISGDSDLVPPVAMVRLRFPKKKITVYVPARNPIRAAAFELRTAAHVHRDLPLLLISKAQFPN